MGQAPGLEPLWPQLAKGDWVRVATQTNPFSNARMAQGEEDWLVVGTLIAVGGDTLVVNTRRADFALPLNSVSQVEVDRGRRSQHRKTALGAAAGLVAGGVLGMAVGMQDCQGGGACGRSAAGAFVLGAGTVGLPLSGLGVLLSNYWTGRSSWEPVAMRP